MYKPTIAISALALTALGVQQDSFHGTVDTPTLLLKEEKMTLEYTVNSGEATIIVEAESEESLGSVEVRSPSGIPLLTLRTRGGHNLALQGFVVETKEGSLSEVLQLYSEGIYDVRAKTTDGRSALGSADLSLDLMPAPVVLYPQEGSVDVPVTDLTVQWLSDTEATGYMVVLEQDENDGLVIELPPGSNSLEVPDGFLKPGTETQLEIGVRGTNGNCTLVEVVFTTE